jgi:PAS domain S-box-containing protein
MLAPLTAVPASDLRARVAELERERELLNAIANYAPSLLCLVGADGVVRPTATNKAFERTLGYTPEETGGVRFWERYVPQEDAAAVRGAIERVIAGGEVVEREGRWLTRSGEVVHVLWSCTPLPMIESGPVFLVSAADISERKQQEEEVRTSRARLVAAADDARRRLERNLHDGAQQRLMSLLLALRMNRNRATEPELFDAPIDELTAALDELRELARGIHPEILTRRGLAAAVNGLADRAPVPVELDVPPGRFAEPVEAAAYYVVSEALANVARYAEASSADIRIAADEGRLVIEVSDDGIGGADAERGTGLRGLADRVASLDGTLAVESPVGQGTRVRAEIPLRPG